MKKTLFFIFLFFIFLLLNHTIKYKYLFYNIPDSAVYNQVLTNILYNGNAYSPLEELSKTTTFNVHFSPILYLIAPLKLFFFNNYILEMLQIFFFVVGIFLLLSKTKNKFLIFILIIISPLNILNVFMNFRTIKLTFFLLILFYHYYKKNYNPGIYITFLLLLFLIETNIFVCFGLILFIMHKNLKQSILLFLILLIVLLFSFYFLDLNRPLQFLSYDFILENLISISLIFFPIIILIFFSRKKMIILPYIIFYLFTSTSTFFGIKKNILFSINYNYYLIPIYTVFLLFLINKKKDFILIILLLNVVIYMPFLNNYYKSIKKIYNINYTQLKKIKQLIPKKSSLAVQWIYVDEFSNFPKTIFFQPELLKNKQFKGYIYIDENYKFVDIIKYKKNIIYEKNEHYLLKYD